MERTVTLTMMMMVMSSARAQCAEQQDEYDVKDTKAKC